MGQPVVPTHAHSGCGAPRYSPSMAMTDDVFAKLVETFLPPFDNHNGQSDMQHVSPFFTPNATYQHPSEAENWSGLQTVILEDVLDGTANDFVRAPFPTPSPGVPVASAGLRWGQLKGDQLGPHLEQFGPPPWQTGPQGRMDLRGVQPPSTVFPQEPSQTPSQAPTAGVLSPPSSGHRGDVGVFVPRAPNPPLPSQCGGMKKVPGSIKTCDLQLEDSEEDSPNDTLHTDLICSVGDKPSSTQEKNRTAQRRFRQRQKVRLVTLEAQVDQLSSRLKKVNQENDNLRNLNNLLEKVLVLREEHIVGLQEAAQLFDQCTLNDQQWAEGGKTEETAGSGDRSIDQNKEGSSDASSGSPGPVLSSSRPFASYSVEEVQGMTFSSFLGLWRHHLRIILDNMGLLERKEGGPQSLKEVDLHMLELGKMCERAAFYKPDLMRRLLSINYETGEPDAGSEDHWGRVVESLYLSDQQVTEVLKARERFLTSLGPILEERQAVSAQLAANQPSILCHSEILRTTSRYSALMDQLKENMKREHNQHVEFCIYLFKKVFTLVQVAKAMVHAYPYFPDPLAISTSLKQSRDQDLVLQVSVFGEGS